MTTQPPNRPPPVPRAPYTPPRLQRHTYTVVTGASFPVGTTGFPLPPRTDD
ncbi:MULTISPECIES: hypothetical protein [Deinococcus]|uniref:Uncharacterized protein n=1 Tax=Deinococcus xianganensis TaxID=1507289 RepID=A0A6I4YQ67_9DEIO|nr:MULTISPECIES: hypothetical protein [Deinococcus]MDK2014347.1 hypothetical protein [Deinococcus sp. 43]MXV21127.1 hypothetical protein [Deinococcus xianganensis]